jgi:hypothetical protein
MNENQDNLKPESPAKPEAGGCSVQRIVRQSFNIFGKRCEHIQSCLLICAHLLVCQVAEAVGGSNKSISVGTVVGNASAMPSQIWNSVSSYRSNLRIAGSSQLGEQAGDMLVKISRTVDLVASNSVGMGGVSTPKTNNQCCQDSKGALHIGLFGVAFWCGWKFYGRTQTLTHAGPVT